MKRAGDAPQNNPKRIKFDNAYTAQKTFYVQDAEKIPITSEDEVQSYLSMRKELLTKLHSLLPLFKIPIIDRYEEIMDLLNCENSYSDIIDKLDDPDNEFYNNSEIFHEIDICQHLPEDMKWYFAYVKMYLEYMRQDLRKAQRSFTTRDDNDDLDSAKHLHPQGVTNMDPDYMGTRIKKDKDDYYLSDGSTYSDSPTDSDDSSSSDTSDDDSGIEDSELLFEHSILNAGEANPVDIKFIKELNLSRSKSNPILLLASCLSENSKTTEDAEISPLLLANYIKLMHIMIRELEDFFSKTK
ncbi:hypothetical protein AKO1_006710, partial [Acrasis kona]